MKKIFLLALAIILASGLILSGSSTEAAPIKLVFASWEGTATIHLPNFEQFKKDLEERTRGKVKVEFAWGAVLGPPAEHFNLVRTGQADIAYWSYLFTAGQHPMAEVVGLPFGDIPIPKLGEALWQLDQKGYFDKELKGVKLLGIFCAGPFHLMMAKHPIDSLNDLKGKKIRAAGIQAKIVRALGAVPVGMAAPEIYGALEKGVIDGALTAYSAVRSFNLGDVVKHYTPIGIGFIDFGVGMNMNSYNKLPKDVQAVIDELIKEKGITIRGNKLEEGQLQMGIDLLNKFGAVKHVLPEADMKKVSQALVPIWDEWIKEGEAKGLPRKAMLDELYGMLKNMGVKKPFHGYPPGS
jgi:TRAP-type C4-dicarboxylate transport system substrate-binding protein